MKKLLLKLAIAISKVIKLVDHKYHLLLGNLLGRKYLIVDGRALYLQDLSDSSTSVRLGVLAGTVGGYLESEHSLSQDGTCVVLDTAKVINDSKVQGNAIVGGESVVSNSLIAEWAEVVSSKVENSFISGITCLRESEVSNATMQKGYHVGLEIKSSLNSFVYETLTIEGKQIILDKSKVIIGEEVMSLPKLNSDIDRWLFVLNTLKEREQNASNQRQVSSQ